MHILVLIVSGSGQKAMPGSLMASTLLQSSPRGSTETLGVWH